MPSLKLSTALVRFLTLLLIFLWATPVLWAQQEGQAALEPLQLDNQSRMSKRIREGKQITLKGFPSKYFEVRGRVLGVSRDSVYLAMDPQTSEQARVKIEDVGSIHYVSIGWLIAGILLLLYAGVAAMVIVVAIALTGGISVAGGALLAGLFIPAFGICLYLTIKAGFRTYKMDRWRIRRGR